MPPMSGWRITCARTASTTGCTKAGSSSACWWPRPACAQNPALDPATLAIEETDRLMDRWFGALLDEKDLPHDRIAAEGRVALLLADGMQRWPYAFLENDGVPEEFVLSMKQNSMKAGPDLAVSSMVPREIDLGIITEAAGQTLDRIDKLPLVRVLLLWAVFAAVLLAVFYATR